MLPWRLQLKIKMQRPKGQDLNLLHIAGCEWATLVDFPRVRSAAVA